MKRTAFLFTLLTAALTAVTSLQAQPRGGGMGGMGGSMSSVFGPAFGKDQNFSAKANISTKSKSGGPQMDSLPMEFAYSGGKIRMEMNMGEAKGAQLTPSAIAQIKQMGMDKTTYIVREDERKMYIVYPNMSAYVEMPMPNAQDSDKTKEPKIEKTEVGKETVDGHPCVKNKVVVSDPETQKAHEMFLWNATDLKDFPVKIETTEGGVTSTFTYSDVKFEKPADSLFEAPTDAKKYNNMQEMMMEKMGGGAGPGGRGPGGARPTPPTPK